ncbi:MAG TPA: hypothetical protein ENJ09_07130 [Planctomycetes bacterium]|nr:hypothetical protein [Planctomycetota bacterium]
MLLSSALSLLLALAPPTAPAAATVFQADPVVARGAGFEVRLSELDDLVLDRFAASEKGRDVLELLTRSRVLDSLAREAGLRVGDRDVAELWRTLDAQLRASGELKGLDAQIEERGVTQDEFRELLRLSIVQERLTRRALGLKEDDPVTESQQEVWLDQELSARGLERPGPPWAEGIAARSGDAVVTKAEFAETLRRRLSPEELQEACWHLLLERAIEARMPDLAPAELERAIDEEIARRRAQHEASYPALSFEQRLAAAGRNLESLRRDPAVRIAALSHLWVDRTYGEEGLRKTYEDDRAFFEGRFGKAAHTSALFLVAGRFRNDLVPRTFDEADAQLRKMANRAGDLADFQALVDRFSEEPKSKERHGELGWVTRDNPKILPPIREAVFDFLDAGGTVPTQGVAVGPLRTESGSVLLWLDALRPSPGWETMREHVHAELRRRLVVDAMPTGAMEILIGNEQKEGAR